jgi:hypothetical protein
MTTTTTPEALTELEGEVAARHNRLTDAVRGLRTKAGDADTARALLIVGGILLPLGAVLIVLGWAGAAHSTDVFVQMPYLISGGLLGLGLVFVGGFCYFAFWQTQLVYAVRRDAADTRASLETLQRIEALLVANANGAAANGAEPPAQEERPARRARKAAR